MKSRSSLALRAANNAVFGAAAIFAVTTIHHLYGASIYHTPWRIHAAIISGLATAVIGASVSLLRGHLDDALGAAASCVFVVATFLVPFLGFGVFEGGYNHLLKVALYFGHASPSLMKSLFPPPTYEMPNDAFFEITGVLQVIPGFITCYYLCRFVRDMYKNEETGPDTRVSAA